MVRIPVAIVGGGPVGLTVALELGRRGIRSVLIEQESDTNDFPRMLFVNYRSMQHCRRWGIADAVRARTIYDKNYPLDIAFTTGLNGHEITRFNYPSHHAAPLPDCVPERSQICPQNIFDPLMRETAQANANTDIRFGHRLEHFEQNGNGVRLDVLRLDDDAKIQINADYLVACDGAGSPVRRALGIDMPGEFHDYNISVLFRAPDILNRTHIDPARHFHIIGQNGFDSILNSVDGGTTWRMGFGGMTEMPDPGSFDAKSKIRAKIGIDVDMDIVAALPWSRSTRTAETYRKDRVFLAGDAAHTWSPTGGFGMNTGLADAVDISWKLAAVLQGWGGEQLLESYDIERRPVCEKILAEARRNYQNLRIKANFQEVVSNEPDGDHARQALAKTIQSTARREYETIGVQMGYHYEGSPINVDDGTKAPDQHHAHYIQTARPGHIAPHAWLDDGRSTMDLFDQSMTLLAFNDTDAGSLVQAARAASMPLTSCNIQSTVAAELYETNLVLVRPDGHVAWRGDSLPNDLGKLIDQVRGVR